MKPIYQATIFLICLFTFPVIKAQDATENKADTLEGWKVGGLISINLSQSSFSNWAAGGDNNLGLSVFYKPFFNYKKGKVKWENSMDFRYGKNKVGSDPWRKSDDKLELTSNFGINAGKNWYYSLQGNFKTQFDKGYENTEDDQYISKFMAPGYVTLALGMAYKPNDKISVFLSPITSRTTFVTDDILSARGDYGVTPGEKSFTQMGPSAEITFKDEVAENVLIDTRANALYDYGKEAKFVFNWDFILGLKVNKFLTTTLTTGMIYDENVLFDVKDDTGTVVDREKRLQFKQLLAIGITFSY